MNIEEFRLYCLQKKAVTESFPFDAVTLVFKVMGKMFALAPLERMPPQANLKCNPERAIELRGVYPEAVLPGYHMNKSTWNTIHLEGIPPDLMKELIDHSYTLIVESLPKYKQAQLKENGG